MISNGLPVGSKLPSHASLALGMIKLIRRLPLRVSIVAGVQSRNHARVVLLLSLTSFPRRCLPSVLLPHGHRSLLVLADVAKVLLLSLAFHLPLHVIVERLSLLDTTQDVLSMPNVTHMCRDQRDGLGIPCSPG